MTPSFSQADAFPVIARLICDLHARKSDFVTHNELVEAFLNDSLGARLIECAMTTDEGEKSKEWWASNMVQWFSQRITAGQSEYASQFERKKRDDGWAYKPVGNAS